MTSPGLGPTSICPWIGNVTPAGRVSAPVLANDALPVLTPIEPFSLILSIATPQPIWYPASSDPPLTEPVTLPRKVPPTSQSRDDSAVVSGATGNWVSSFAEMVSVRPSWVCAMPGTSDPTTPVSGGGPASGAGTGGGGGSARASGAVPTGTSRQIAAKVAKRFNMSRLRLSSSESPRDRQDLSRGIFDGPSVQTVNGRTTVETPCLSSRHLPWWQRPSKQKIR